MQNIQIKDFGIARNGVEILQYTLQNRNGMKLEFINLGGIITKLTAPDRNGNYEDVVLGYADPKVYLSNPCYFGAIIGRFGNRIANASFSIDDEVFQIENNEGENSLHSGNNGFHNVIWDVNIIEDSIEPKVQLSYVSEDGEGGFPGTLRTEVNYSLTKENELKIEYKATTDKATIVNLTHHSYYNLSGNFSQEILDHVIQINGQKIVEVDEKCIPTGNLRSVSQTPFNFTNPKLLGSDINALDEQLQFTNGYDHTWVLDGKGFRSIAQVYHEASGRLMEVFTDQPGVQFYTGNSLSNQNHGKHNDCIGKRTGLCLETQHYPDSPNQPSFPTVVLRSNEMYQSTTVYQFSVR